MDGVRPFDGNFRLRYGAAATASCGIAFMAKASAPGRAKTRLVPPLTFDEAAALNTAFLCDVADNLLLAARSRRAAWRNCRLRGLRTDRGGGFLPPHLAGSDRLDRRLAAQFRRLSPSHHRTRFFQARPRFGRSAQLRQSDFADRTADRDRRGAGAAGRSRRARSVAATAAIICLGSRPRIAACSKTSLGARSASPNRRLQRARDIGLEVHTLPVWYDVDDTDGLRRLNAELSGEDERRRDAYAPHYAVQTAKLMQRLWRDHDFGGRIGRLMQIDEARA